MTESDYKFEVRGKQNHYYVVMTLYEQEHISYKNYSLVEAEALCDSLQSNFKQIFTDGD